MYVRGEQFNPFFIKQRQNSIDATKSPFENIDYDFHNCQGKKWRGGAKLDFLKSGGWPGCPQPFPVSVAKRQLSPSSPWLQSKHGNPKTMWLQSMSATNRRKWGRRSQTNGAKATGCWHRRWHPGRSKMMSTTASDSGINVWVVDYAPEGTILKGMVAISILDEYLFFTYIPGTFGQHLVYMCVYIYINKWNVIYENKLSINIYINHFKDFPLEAQFKPTSWNIAHLFCA